MNKKEPFTPWCRLPGRYSSQDGTIEFFNRVRAISKKNDVVLDLGAGRGSWMEGKDAPFRRKIRFLKGDVCKVILADIDEAVFLNKSGDETVMIEDGKLPLSDDSVDMIISDYVLEHVENPQAFTSEIRRVLKRNGWFCARTPHKYSYVAIGAQIIGNQYHRRWVKNLQPGRKSIDVFPTAYKLNTLVAIEKYFENFESYSYLYSCDPAYYWGSKLLFRAFEIIHKITPRFFSSNLFIFVQNKK